MKISIKGPIISDSIKYIYDHFGIAATSPSDISNALEKANGQAIDVYINSGGGHIDAGSEIYFLLKDYVGEVLIHVVGTAASAASVIAMAGKSEMASTALIMVHNVSSMASGDYHDMDKSSEILQTANKALATSYMEKSGMSEVDVLAMMDSETWLTADQAVEKRLIDNIAFKKPKTLVASFDSGLLPMEVIEKMQNSLINEKSLKAEDTTALIQKQKTQTKLNLLKLGGTK